MRVFILLSALLPCSVAFADEIRFRSLTQDDFRGTIAPSEVGWHPRGVEAVSCLRIVWPADLAVEFSTRGGGSVPVVVTAALPELRFVAVFDRLCSWWAPDPVDPGYALLHEQIHFAISEHAARVATRELRSLGRIVRAQGASREEAHGRLTDQLRHLAISTQLATRSEHRAFDAFTRADRSAESQLEWLRRYEHLLGTTLVRSLPPNRSLQTR